VLTKQQYSLPSHSSILVDAHNLTSLNSLHLANPTRRRLELAHSSQLIQTVTRDANTVVALEHHLNVLDLQRLALSEFGQLASPRDDVVDEVIGQRQNSLFDIGRKSVLRRDGAGDLAH